MSPGEYHNMVWFYQVADDEVPEVAVSGDDLAPPADAEEDSKVCNLHGKLLMAS